MFVLLLDFRVYRSNSLTGWAKSAQFYLAPGPLFKWRQHFAYPLVCPHRVGCGNDRGRTWSIAGSQVG